MLRRPSAALVAATAVVLLSACTAQQPGPQSTDGTRPTDSATEATAAAPVVEVVDPGPGGVRVSADGLLGNYYAADEKAPGVLVLGVDRGGTICVANQLATELFGRASAAAGAASAASARQAARVRRIMRRSGAARCRF